MSKHSTIASRSSIAHSTIATNTSQRVNEEDDLAFDMLDHGTVTTNITFETIDTRLSKPKGTSKCVLSKRKRLARIGSRLRSESTESNEKAILKKSNIDNADSSNSRNLSSSVTFKLDEGTAFEDSRGMRTITLVDMSPGVKLTEKQRLTLLNMACTYEDTGDMYLQVNNFEEAQDSFRQFHLISIAVFGKDGLDVANGLLKLAKVELMKTDNKNLEVIDKYYQEAYRIRAKKLGRDHEKVVDVLGNRAAFLIEHNMADAIECFNNIVEIKSNLDEVDTAEIASLYMAMGECNLDLESFEDALICFKCALTLLRKGNTSNFELLDCYGTLLFLVATANEKLGDELVAEGDSFYLTEAKDKFKDAVDYFAEAVKILRRRKTLSQPDIKHALSRINICKQKQRLVENDSALDIFDVYLSGKSANEGNLTMLGEQARLERKRGIVESLKTTSIPSDKQVTTSDAKSAKKKLDGPERAKHLEDELVSFLQRGLVYFAGEDFLQAMENYKKAAAIITFLWGNEHMELALVFEKLAEIELALVNQGKDKYATCDRAVKYCSDALRINRVNKNSFNAMHILSKVKLLLKSRGIDVKTYEVMGNHCIRMKKYPEAIECYKHAFIATKATLGENNIHAAFLLTKMANVEALISSAPARNQCGIGQVSNYFEHALKIVQKNDTGIDHIKALKILHKASSGDIMFHRDMGYVALQFYEESLASIDSIMGKGQYTGSAIRLNMAEICFAKSEYERAFDLFQEGLDTRSGRESLDEEYAIISHCIGLTLEKQGDDLHKKGQGQESMAAYFASSKRFHGAYSIFSTILGNSHDDVINTLHHCAYVSMKIRRYDDALGMYQKELVCVRSLSVDDERLPGILRAKATAHVKKTHYDEALDCLEELLGFVRKNKPDDDQLLEKTLMKIAPIYGYTKNYEKAISAYSEALQIKLSQKGAIEDPRIRYKVGRLYMMSNKPGLAAALYEEALPMLTANFDDHYRDIFTTLRLLGNIYFDQGTYMFHRALGCYECALKIWRKYPECQKSVTVESILNNMGFIYYTVGDVLKAIESFKKAAKIYEANNGIFNHRYASLRHNLANVFLKLGDNEEAKLAYNEAFTIKIQLMRLVGDDTILLNPLENMGATYVRLRDYGRALECYEGMRVIRESELGKHSLPVCGIHQEIAHVHCRMANYGKAKASYKRVLKILVTKLGYSHEVVMDILYKFGLVLFKNEEYDAALKLYDTTMQSKTTSEAKRAVILNRIANVFMKKGEYDVALNYYQLSLDMKNKTVGNNHKSVARTLYNIGLVCHREGLTDEAADYLRSALDIDRRSPGNIHPMKIAKTMVSVGKAYYLKGNFSDASSLFREVEQLLLQINIPADDDTLERTQLYVGRCKTKMNFATGDWSMV